MSANNSYDDTSRMDDIRSDYDQSRRHRPAADLPGRQCLYSPVRWLNLKQLGNLT